ncbi:hypothetical protein [Frankia sp. CiP3]|uniref:hypothetical protein n=1 Tax=Frankia sp. CiP3 TaxID=2880971 RepID=UPI001EF742FE|nr:hypothetical protein [Frankia sp. CiP3]
MTGHTSTAGSGGERVTVGSSWHVGLHVGSDWSVRCLTYPDERPILALNTPGAHLSLSTADGIMTADHIDFAHALVQAANDYLIDCERLVLDRVAAEVKTGPVRAA